MTRPETFLLAALALLAPHAAISAQNTACARDTRQIVRSPAVRRTSKDFLSSFTSLCKSGEYPELCEKPAYDASKIPKAVTRIMNYTALEETTEYSDFATACRENNFVPVQIDDEVRYKSVPGRAQLDTRILGIGLLHCLPENCANDFNDMRDAYYLFEGDTIKSISERLDFHRDTAPDDAINTQSGSCDPRSADWMNWSANLQGAYNRYVEVINKDCSSSQPKNYCRALYRSLGEFNAQTLRFYNHFDTEEFRAYTDACTSANGDICAFDMTLSFQGVRASTEWWKEDRGDVNHVFLGYPECYARTCSYEEKNSLTEKNHLNQMLNKFANRRLREVRSRDEISHGGPSIDRTVSSIETAVMLSNYTSPGMTPSKADGPLRIQARFEGVDSAIYDDIPEASFLDYITEHSETSSILIPNRKLYKMYEGQAKCGNNASRCYSRLSNFCLRRA